MSTAALVIAFIVIAAVIIGGFMLLMQGVQNPNATLSPSPPTATESAASLPSPTSNPTATPSPTPSPTASPTPSVSPTAHSSPLPNAGTITFDISAINFKFDPGLITIQSGQKVKIDFHNEDALPHNLAVEGLNITTKTIDPGQDDSIEFIAPIRGNYNFFCSIPGHREAGMTGAIRVE